MATVNIFGIISGDREIRVHSAGSFDGYVTKSIKGDTVADTPIAGSAIAAAEVNGLVPDRFAASASTTAAAAVTAKEHKRCTDQ